MRMRVLIFFVLMPKMLRMLLNVQLVVVVLEIELTKRQNLLATAYLKIASVPPRTGLQLDRHQPVEWLLPIQTEGRQGPPATVPNRYLTLGTTPLPCAPASADIHTDSVAAALEP